MATDPLTERIATTVMDKLFLKLSQFTTAKTAREIELEEQLKRLIAISSALMAPLEEIGDDTNWRDGVETDRVYPWCEFEPLVDILNELKDDKENDEK